MNKAVHIGKQVLTWISVVHVWGTLTQSMASKTTVNLLVGSAWWACSFSTASQVTSLLSPIAFCWKGYAAYGSHNNLRKSMVQCNQIWSSGLPFLQKALRVLKGYMGISEISGLTFDKQDRIKINLKKLHLDCLILFELNSLKEIFYFQLCLFKYSIRFRVI